MEKLRRSVKKASLGLKNGGGAPDFWALVRALENGNPEKPRLGFGKNPAEENVRFGQAPFLHFPPTDIAEIIEGGRRAGVDAVLIVYFFGLLGVNGPLPLEFTNYIFRRSHNYFDNTWRRFLDIIHHRFLALYYRSHAANQQAISFDRPTDDPISGIVKSLAGFPPEQERGGRQEKLVLKLAQHFSLPVKNRWGLEDALRRTFRFNLELKDFVPAAYNIPPADYAVLGRRGNSVLGLKLQIGRTCMSITGKFEIHIGPIAFEKYHEFISGRNGLSLMNELIALYLDRPLDYAVVFSVPWNTIPLAQLGFDLEKGRWDAPRLGYTCWIGNPEEQITALDISIARVKRKTISF